MQRRLRVLLVEDSEDDAGLIALELRRGGFDPSCRRVETAEGMRTALETEQFDVVICDYLLPGFAALPAIAMRRRAAATFPSSWSPEP